VTGRLPKTSDETASFKVSRSFDDLTLDSSSWDLDPECYGMDSSPNLYEPSLPLPTSNLSSNNNTSLLSDQLNGLAGGSLSAVVLSSNTKQQLVNNSSSIPSSSPSSKLSSTGSSSSISRDFSPHLSRTAAGVLNAAVAELAADLNSPEISFDLQQFISSEIASAQAASASLSNLVNNTLAVNTGHHHHSLVNQHQGVISTDDSVSLFTELLNSAVTSSTSTSSDPKKASNNNPSGNPTNSGSGGGGNMNVGFNFSTSNNNHNRDRYSTSLDIKSERGVVIDDPYGACQGGYTGGSGGGGASFGGGNSFSTTVATPNQLTTHYVGTNPGLISSRSAASGHLNHQGSGHHGTKKSSKKHADKGSDEYKKRRERNNVAVRKSREKAKMRSRETEKRVSELQRDNDTLRKRVDLLGSQLNVLKNLLTNVGVPAESIDSEIARNLQMEGHL